MAESTQTKQTLRRPPAVRVMDMQRPWAWLRAGWADLRRNPVASIAYGALFVVMGHVLLAVVADQAHMALVLISGFMLVAPILAMGLYDLSRRLEQGQPATLWHALTAWWVNGRAVALFGLLLGIVMMFWVRTASVIFGVMVGSRGFVVAGDASDVFLGGIGLEFLLVFMGVGALFAALVFVISVVSIPLMLDRRADAITAVVTSVNAVRANPRVMVLWAALIVVFTLIGMAPMMLGLALTLPLIGHATWHAYRDIVEPA